MAPDVRQQIAAAQRAGSLTAAVAAMNALVTEPCPVPKRTWRTAWLRPRRHAWVDYTAAMGTSAYATLDRCQRCGVCELGEGL